MKKINFKNILKLLLFFNFFIWILFNFKLTTYAFSINFDENNTQNEEVLLIRDLYARQNLQKDYESLPENIRIKMDKYIDSIYIKDTKTLNEFIPENITKETKDMLKDKQILGFYEMKEENGKICRNIYLVKQPFTSGILIHEVGHFVDDLLNQPSLSKDFEEFFIKDAKYFGNYTEERKECFAEMFYFYITNPEYMKEVDMSLYSYLDNIVKSL